MLKLIYPLILTIDILTAKGHPSKANYLLGFSVAEEGFWPLDADKIR